MSEDSIRANDEYTPFWLFPVLLIAAFGIPTTVIYNLAWYTGSAQKMLAEHCGEKGEVVAYGLLWSFGFWFAVANAAYLVHVIRRRKRFGAMAASAVMYLIWLIPTLLDV